MQPHEKITRTDRYAVRFSSREYAWIVHDERAGKRVATFEIDSEDAPVPQHRMYTAQWEAAKTLATFLNEKVSAGARKPLVEEARYSVLEYPGDPDVLRVWDWKTKRPVLARKRGDSVSWEDFRAETQAVADAMNEGVERKEAPGRDRYEVKYRPGSPSRWVVIDRENEVVLAGYPVGRESNLAYDRASEKADELNGRTSFPGLITEHPRLQTSRSPYYILRVGSWREVRLAKAPFTPITVARFNDRQLGERKANELAMKLADELNEAERAKQEGYPYEVKPTTTGWEVRRFNAEKNVVDIIATFSAHRLGDGGAAREAEATAGRLNERMGR